MNYLTVPLDTSHKKKYFKCGKEMLDVYLHQQAKQDVKRKLATCLIMPGENGVVKGYYTLSASSIARELLPEIVKKNLPPSYKDLPVILVGRLAVDLTFKGQGLGGMLLLDALRRSYETAFTKVGSMAVIVDPIDDEAQRFYAKYEFILLPGSGKQFLTMNTISLLFR